MSHLLLSKEIRWWMGRLHCRILNRHNWTCRARPDHYLRDGTFIGRPW